MLTDSIPKENIDDFEPDLDLNIDFDEDENIGYVSLESSKLVTNGKHEKENVDVSEKDIVFEEKHLILLESIESYLILLPNHVLATRFDILKIFDEYFEWENRQSSEDVSKIWKRRISREVDLVAAILRIARHYTMMMNNYLHWFGTKEESSKLLINILVSDTSKVENQQNLLFPSTKWSILAKLLLLCSNQDVSQNPKQNNDIFSKANSLLKLVIQETNLFAGHGVADLVMNVEIQAWLSIVTTTWDETEFNIHHNSLFIIDCLFHLSVHFAVPICIDASSIYESSIEKKDKGIDCGYYFESIVKDIRDYSSKAITDDAHKLVPFSS